MNNVKIRSSILSGMLIGIGNVIYLTSGNHYAGAMLFSLALLTIIHNNLPLYTGKIGFIDKYDKMDFVKMLLGNLIGVTVIMFAAVLSMDNLYKAMAAVAEVKFSSNILSTFILGFLCGVLMLIAVYSKNTVITVFCIMVFILSGYKHCIADFPYTLINFSVIKAVKFLCIVLGNSLGAIVTHKLIE